MWLVSSKIKHCFTMCDSVKTFPSTLERPPFCLLVRSFLQSKHLQVLSELFPIQFIMKRQLAVWMNTSMCEVQIQALTGRKGVYYYIAPTLLTPINVSSIRETGGETGWSHEERWARCWDSASRFSWVIMKCHGQNEPNPITPFGCTKHVSASILTPTLVYLHSPVCLARLGQ